MRETTTFSRQAMGETEEKPIVCLFFKVLVILLIIVRNKEIYIAQENYMVFKEKYSLRFAWKLAVELETPFENNSQKLGTIQATTLRECSI